LNSTKKLPQPQLLETTFQKLLKKNTLTKIFTDPSKSSRGTGFAFVENKNTSMFKPPPETSIFSAESQAIHKVISHATTLVTEEILIISDSLSALFSLENPYHKNETIRAIQEKLTHARKKIEFIWIPSLTGIIGNKHADKAANEVITSPNSVIVKKITFQDALKKTINLIKSHWRETWEATPNTNKLKKIKLSIK